MSICLTDRVQDSKDSLAPQSIDQLHCPPMISAEEIIASMESPIALVGNGPFERLHGELIDSHPTIIRINNFRLKGFESAVGSRCTHWCSHGRIDAMSLRGNFFMRLLARVYKRRRVGILYNEEIVGKKIKAFAPKAFEWVSVDTCKEYLGIDLHCVRDVGLLYRLATQFAFQQPGLLHCTCCCNSMRALTCSASMV